MESSRAAKNITTEYTKYTEKRELRQSTIVAVLPASFKVFLPSVFFVYSVVVSLRSPPATAPKFRRSSLVAAERGEAGLGSIGNRSVKMSVD